MPTQDEQPEIDQTRAALLDLLLSKVKILRERKREFAADMALQAHALRMAAEGAVTAYERVVGEAWKPFERAVENPAQSVDRKAAELQMAALG